MKKIPINKPVNLNLLTEELFTQFPDWSYPDPMGRGWNVTDVTITPETIEYPDATNDDQVRSVLAAHDPGGMSKNKKSEADKKNKSQNMRDRAVNAKSVNDLRDIILDMLT